jgi:hypothetical protein
MTAAPNPAWFKLPTPVPYCTRLLLAEFKSVCQTTVMDVGVTICKYGSRTTAALAGRPDATNKQSVIHNLIMLAVSPVSGGERIYYWGERG